MADPDKLLLDERHLEGASLVGRAPGMGEATLRALADRYDRGVDWDRLEELDDEDKDFQLFVSTVRTSVYYSEMGQGFPTL